MVREDLLNLDLQLFGEEETEAGETDLEPAEQGSEETTEVESEETVETEGNDEPTEQSAEENARYAAIRRRAEDDAQRRQAAKDEQRNQRIAAMCNGVTHPVTGQPVTNIDDYLDALEIQQRQAQEKELQEKGVDPSLIDRMVAQNPAVLQAQMYMDRIREQEQLSQIQRDVEEIAKLDPEIKTAEDLVNAPYCQSLIEYCQTHKTSLLDAFKILNFNSLLTNRDSASRQQAINEMRGKAHLPSQPNGVATENDDVEVPAEIMSSWKAEGKTEKQIRDLYKTVANKLNLN